MSSVMKIHMTYSHTKEGEDNTFILRVDGLQVFYFTRVFFWEVSILISGLPMSIQSIYEGFFRWCCGIFNVFTSHFSCFVPPVYGMAISNSNSYSCSWLMYWWNPIWICQATASNLNLFKNFRTRTWFFTY